MYICCMLPFRNFMCSRHCSNVGLLHICSHTLKNKCVESSPFSKLHTLSGFYVKCCVHSLIFFYMVTLQAEFRKKIKSRPRVLVRPFMKQARTQIWLFLKVSAEKKKSKKKEGVGIIWRNYRNCKWVGFYLNFDKSIAFKSNNFCLFYLCSAN